MSTKENDFSRALIIQGASHFSPIRVDSQVKGNDLLKLNDSFVGANPIDIQDILKNEIIDFLDQLENKKTIPVTIKKYNNNLRVHILDRQRIAEVIKN